MRIFVGCSSKNEIPKDYLSLAVDVGHLLFEDDVVIGGSRQGMMGVISNTVPFEHVTQVILKDYLKQEEMDFHKVYVCDTSFARIQKIWDLSDCFLILPGGTGTLSEIFGFLEENRTKEKKKKIFVLNYHGFYDELLEFIEKAKRLLFSDENVFQGICFIDSVDEIQKVLKKEEEL